MAIPLRYLIITQLYLVFLLPSFSNAGIKTFIKEYTYHASEIDSKYSCRINALVQIKRLLLEEIGTYIRSHTVVKNSQIVKDEISILTAGIVKTKIDKETWDGEKYWLRAEVQVDSDDVSERVERLRSDWDKTDELKSVRNQLESTLVDNEKLKQELQGIKEGLSSAHQLNLYKQNIDKINALELYTQAIAQYEHNNFERAIELLQESIDLNPSSQRAYEFLGRCFLESGQTELTKRSAKDILARTFNPADSETYAVRGFAYHALNKEAKSVKEYTMGIELNPNDSRLYRIRSNSLSKLGRISLALKDINKAIALKPEDYRNYMIRGFVYGRNRSFNKAMIDFAKALQMNPNSAKTFFFRGIIHKRQKNFRMAKQDLEKACRMGFYMACKKNVTSISPVSRKKHI
jgi:tetratricopeptide (TPR) repeat protein